MARHPRWPPGPAVVCTRFRTACSGTSAYAEAVRTAAPEAVQIADRFHLWLNLYKTVKKCVVAHRRCLAPIEDEARSRQQNHRLDRR
ncbi:transposase [Streptantibioticus rubrisoli]|uniref:transposase n=1 Tax=Streptantibioticus rubrisoli TaxID=1387313 RepID=UPI0035591F4F